MSHHQNQVTAICVTTRQISNTFLWLRNTVVQEGVGRDMCASHPSINYASWEVFSLLGVLFILPCSLIQNDSKPSNKWKCCFVQKGKKRSFFLLFLIKILRAAGSLYCRTTLWEKSTLHHCLEILSFLIRILDFPLKRDLFPFTHR